MKGRLKDRPLDLLVHEIHARMPSGVLTLERGPCKKQICFVKGTVRFAASNLQEDRLGDFLVRAGLLPEPAMRRAEGALVPGQRLWEFLLASGLLSPEQLRDAARAHALDIVVPCLDWRSGEYRYDEGLPNISGQFATDIPVAELVLERARRRVTERDVNDLLNDGHAAMLPPSLPGRDLDRLKLTKAEALIMARAAEGERLCDVLAVAPSLRPELARAAAGLFASGLIATAAPGAGRETDIYDTKPPAPRAQASAVAEGAPPGAGVRYYKQMHDLLLGADHYRTLGVETTATAEEVRRAYYTLAKEIHPDRFLSPPLDSLHQEMEELFAQVLEAYNTLVDPEARAHYESERMQKGLGPKEQLTDQQKLARGNFLRGRTLFDEGKPAEALRFLQNAVELDPNKPEYVRLLGMVQSRNPRLRHEAEVSFLKAIELDPARPEAYLHLGKLYRRMGELEKAVEKLRECLKWDPSNTEAGAVLAELAQTVGKGP